MDIVSYLLGKKNGGSDFDWSKLGYTTVPEVLTEGYNYALEIKNNWDDTETVLTDRYNNDHNLVYFPVVDTSNVITLSYTFIGCALLQYIPLLDTSNVTNMDHTFAGCRGLKEIPAFNTSKVITFTYAFNNCDALTTIPVLDTSGVTGSGTNLRYTFYGCPSLSNTSLDNILQMCINATSYTGTKTLEYMGFVKANYPAATIQALPHYQDFIDAGWTIGY